jgi:hypothetical protein
MIGMAIIIGLIVATADTLIEYHKKPQPKNGVFLANKVAEYEKEQPTEQKALSNRIHSIEWNASTREVQEIQYEEVY